MDREDRRRGWNRNLPDRASLPKLRTPPITPHGPRLFREPKDKGYIGGAGIPPDEFLNGNNSEYEWQIYRALASITGEPQNPEQPPYIGAPGIWIYQKAWDQGRREPGGSVIDFLVYGGFGDTAVDTAIRIQTEYFHIFTDAEKHSADLIQKWRLAQFFRVVDIYDYQFAWDKTNEAAVRVVKQALQGDTFTDPTTSGMAERVRENVQW